MKDEEIQAMRELAAAVKALAEALTPKIGGLGYSPLFTVRCECHCGDRRSQAPWGAGMGGI